MRKNANAEAMNMLQVKVLLIDDDPDFARLVLHWLSRPPQGRFVVQWSASLQAALSRLQQGRVDVILLDLGLPDCGGTDTFSRVKRVAARTPVILLSGDASETLTLHLIPQGAEDYVVYKSSTNACALATAIQYAAARNC
jgi:DNA-binding response OmpR family regulator